MTARSSARPVDRLHRHHVADDAAPAAVPGKVGRYIYGCQFTAVYANCLSVRLCLLGLDAPAHRSRCSQGSDALQAYRKGTLRPDGPFFCSEHHRCAVPDSSKAAVCCDDRVLDACYQGDIGGQVAQSLEPPIECAPGDLIVRR